MATHIGKPLAENVWYHADHWRDVLVQERTRQKYALVLELTGVETIPQVGEIRLWLGSLSDLGHKVGYRGDRGASALIESFMKRELVVTVCKGNHSSKGVYACFESRSAARAFKQNGYPRKVHEWLLQAKPWVLRPEHTATEKTATLPAAVAAQTEEGAASYPSSSDIDTPGASREIAVVPEHQPETRAEVLDPDRFRRQSHTRFFLEDRPAKISGTPELPCIIGTSRALEHIAALVARVARTDATVLISGETGVGKELVAQWIHLKSRRNQGPFVPVNCAAVPDGLFESVFFGHTRGAFTGADRSLFGLFHVADGGTLFLDEVGDLSLASQAKLLSTLETHTYRPIGLQQTFTSDFRIISATNKNLAEEVRQGAFRDDMLHRVNVFPIHVPPLRDRREDVPLLLEFFVELLSKKMLRSAPTVDPLVLSLVRDYYWPGNIRELRNVVERALIVCDDVLAQEHIVLDPFCGLNRSETEIVKFLYDSDREKSFLLPDPFGQAGFDKTVEALQRAIICAALERHGGVKSRAADAIRLNRTTFLEKHKRLTGNNGIHGRGAL